jgi:hypothetical protein
VSVAHKICEYGSDGAHDLHGDVPARPDDLEKIASRQKNPLHNNIKETEAYSKNHANRENHTKCRAHDKDMDPQHRVLIQHIRLENVLLSGAYRRNKWRY